MSGSEHLLILGTQRAVVAPSWELVALQEIPLLMEGGQLSMPMTPPLWVIPPMSLDNMEVRSVLRLRFAPVMESVWGSFTVALADRGSDLLVREVDA